jgi:hypothetical protein
MQKRKLGNSNLEVSAIGLGCNGGLPIFMFQGGVAKILAKSPTLARDFCETRLLSGAGFGNVSQNLELLRHNVSLRKE